jgi:hypothetical protein
VDEEEYREVYHSVNTVRCAFEKAMLTRRFGCENLIKHNIAEREAAGCMSEKCQEECKVFLGHLRRNAAFVLKVTATSGPLPHAKELKAQCGGLIGLQLILNPGYDQNSKIENIYGMIREATSKYHSVEQIPFQEINKYIAQFQGRRKRQRRE